MRTTIVTSIIMFLGAIPAAAMPVDESAVTRAAANWLAQGEIMTRPDARFVSAVPFRDGGEIVAWVLELDGGGYCIAGADDLQLPVQLYAPEGRYSEADVSLQEYLKGMAARLRGLRDILDGKDLRPAPDPGLVARRRELWRDLQAGAPAPDKAAATYSPSAMSLPLRSAWHQDWPFNLECPELPSYGNTLVGCVAMSMSQIMHYWQWPPTGIGSFNRVWEYRHKDVWIGTPLDRDPGVDGFSPERLRWQNGRLEMTGTWDYSVFWAASAIAMEDSTYQVVYQDAMTRLFDAMDVHLVDNAVDFSQQTYDWANMGDVVDGDNPVENAALAQLCYNAAVSVNMLWGYWVSYSSIGEGAAALENHFRYDPDVESIPFDYNLVVEDIRWGRPVQVQGGGHAFVILGYDDTTSPPRLVINIGNGGSAFLSPIDDLAGFAVNLGIARNIAPLGAVRFVGGAGAGDGSPDAPYDDFVQAAAATPAGGAMMLRVNEQFSTGGAPLVLSQPVTIRSSGPAVVGN